MLELSSDPRARRWQLTAFVGIPMLALLWSFWTTLGDVAAEWSRNPQYSHGYLVPLFACFLLWFRRKQFHLDQMRPAWWGAGLIMAGVGLRLWGAYFHYVWFDHIALLPCIAGVCFLLGGWGAWKWAWPAILFLFFMIPLPYSIATSLASPLQKLATVTSTYALQTLGLPALAEGNVILIDENRIGIVEACSGLRMLVVFFALATGLALVVKRPIADKAMLVLSAVPIALFVNVVRVTITGLLYVMVEDNEVAEVFFHDVAGWLMMPLALALLWLELKIIGRLLIDPESSPRNYTRADSRAPTMTRSRRRDRNASAPGIAGAKA